MEVLATADLQGLQLLMVSGLVSCQRMAFWGRAVAFCLLSCEVYGSIYSTTVR
jgi:hypothetical protein